VYDEVRVNIPSATASASEQDFFESGVPVAATVPNPPFWGSRVIRGIPLRDIFPWINTTALFRGQWQYHRGDRSEAEYEQFVEDEVQPVFRRWQETAIAKQLLQPQVVYGYFPALADRNDLLVWRDCVDGKPVGEPLRFQFPRQTAGKRLCIADFFLSAEDAKANPGGPQFDVVSFTLVTMGSKASEYAQTLFDTNEYRDYLHWHGFSVESAEALAEMWHRRVREELGIADGDAPEMKKIFSGNYQGARYSFGYPACPDLEDQALIAELLGPERIGVELSETFQWHPEQSTSALVAHHPKAGYFVVR
jgi:5-methyltetrahydrofolate--homocysteine methyltransferase